MGENKFRILEKTSPILHSSFIIHHSSFIIFSISTSPKFLRSPFFQTAKLLQNIQHSFPEILREKKPLWSGLDEDVKCFLPMQPPIERNVDSAKFSAGKKQIEVLDDVACQYGYTVTAKLH